MPSALTTASGVPPARVELGTTSFGINGVDEPAAFDGVSRNRLRPEGIGIPMFARCPEHSAAVAPAAVIGLFDFVTFLPTLDAVRASFRPRRFAKAA